MGDIIIEKRCRAGRITLDRPDALNALTYAMCLEIEAGLDAWREDDDIGIVVIDATGERAFCAGGDIQEMYRTAIAGDFDYGRRFWADEYRLNARIAAFPKPYIAFMHGFVMGGGVGVSAHGSHRIVCETSAIAMPECGIGLVPDVGGSRLLARAPGHLGEYLGLTGTRMGPGCAIHAGFADHFIPRAHWPALIATLEESGSADPIAQFAETPPDAAIAIDRAAIDTAFGQSGIAEILNHLGTDAWATDTQKKLARQSPLSLACALQIIRAARSHQGLADSLALEYRFTYRSASHGDFIEGIRASVIDKDRNPSWQHASLTGPTPGEVSAMLAPLGPDELNLVTHP